jgi:tetratricopeptide (TPR) repeat protein
MNSFKKQNTLLGWLMFAVAAVVYILTAEPTGSLWDCGEFISAAHKLEVVHPPGAPLFLMIGRMFAFVADTFSADKANIAYALNVMSGLCTAALVMFVFWSTTILSRLSLVGYGKPVEDMGDRLAILGSGVVAALATTFTTSVWFSAVEGEVYAMSSGFTGLVIWAALRWYVTDTPKADRWLVFIAYMAGLSIGVHLLSLLAIPFIALLFYFKKSRVAKMQLSSNAMYIVLGFALLVGLQFMSWMPVWLHVILGLGIPALYVYGIVQSPQEERKIWINIGISFAVGFAILMFVQSIFIPKLPEIGAGFDFVFVNSFGLPVGSGMIFFAILLVGLVGFGVYVASKRQLYYVHMGLMMFSVALMGFSTYASIVIRAQANTPINMNKPSDAYSLLSYINREQYGERPLAYGPHFNAQAIRSEETGKVYRPVDNNGKVRYAVVGKKIKQVFQKSDQMPFPRLGHMDDARKAQYRRWLGLENDENPTMSDNLDFFFRYQIGWMYFRYFMWNFAGRQNAKQGFYETDPTKGNWMSGIAPIDGARLIPQKNLPEARKHDKGRNTYYFLPLIFGIIGLIFHISKRPQEALALGILFLITGVAIILFSNQPPNEPRERDYVLVGSMFTFCMWIGLSVSALYGTLKDFIKNAQGSAALATAVVIIAPLIMGFQNWDDHSRAKHTGARDYAVNFLESCAPNAIVFTYGDNDTYPLWYAQEVEGIRTDVRVINFSLLAVDWYIDQLRRKINESPAVKMSIPRSAYQGDPRNYLPIQDSKRPMNLIDIVNFIGKSNPTQMGQMQFPSYVPTADVVIPVDKKAVRANKAVPDDVPDSLIANQIKFRFSGRMLIKDDIALMDILGTNIANGWERPIYFAVTVRPSKIGGLRNYLQLEGMALRIVPIQSNGGGRMGAMSMGRVAVDTMYKNMMEKFRWGGFDKHELFVDESYMPSIQTLQFAFTRLAGELQQRGDKEKAIQTLDKMFEAFPHMNFPIDESFSRSQALEIYAQLGVPEKAEPHLRDLVLTTADKLQYYSQFTAPVNIQQFVQETRKISQQMDQKANQLNQMIKMLEDPQVPQNQQQQIYAQANKLQAEYSQLQAQKDQYINACSNPTMARVFEDEISMSFTYAQMVMRTLERIPNKAFVDEMNGFLTPLGFPAVGGNPSPPPTKPEAPKTDTADQDS